MPVQEEGPDDATPAELPQGPVAEIEANGVSGDTGIVPVAEAAEAQGAATTAATDVAVDTAADVATAPEAADATAANGAAPTGLDDADAGALAGDEAAAGVAPPTEGGPPAEPTRLDSDAAAADVVGAGGLPALDSAPGTGASTRTQASACSGKADGSPHMLLHPLPKRVTIQVGEHGGTQHKPRGLSKEKQAELLRGLEAKPGGLGDPSDSDESTSGSGRRKAGYMYTFYNDSILMSPVCGRESISPALWKQRPWEKDAAQLGRPAPSGTKSYRHAGWSVGVSAPPVGDEGGAQSEPEMRGALSPISTRSNGNASPLSPLSPPVLSPLSPPVLSPLSPLSKGASNVLPETRGADGALPTLGRQAQGEAAGGRGSDSSQPSWRYTRGLSAGRRKTALDWYGDANGAGDSSKEAPRSLSVPPLGKCLRPSLHGALGERDEEGEEGEGAGRRARKVLNDSKPALEERARCALDRLEVSPGDCVHQDAFKKTLYLMRKERPFFEVKKGNQKYQRLTVRDGANDSLGVKWEAMLQRVIYGPYSTIPHDHRADELAKLRRALRPRLLFLQLLYVYYSLADAIGMSPAQEDGAGSEEFDALRAAYQVRGGGAALAMAVPSSLTAATSSARSAASGAVADLATNSEPEYVEVTSPKSGRQMRLGQAWRFLKECDLVGSRFSTASYNRLCLPYLLPPVPADGSSHWMPTRPSNTLHQVRRVSEDGSWMRHEEEHDLSLRTQTMEGRAHKAQGVGSMPRVGPAGDVADGQMLDTLGGRAVPAGAPGAPVVYHNRYQTISFDTFVESLIHLAVHRVPVVPNVNLRERFVEMLAAHVEPRSMQPLRPRSLEARLVSWELYRDVLQPVEGKLLKIFRYFAVDRATLIRPGGPTISFNEYFAMHEAHMDATLESRNVLKTFTKATLQGDGLLPQIHHLNKESEMIFDEYLEALARCGDICKNSGDGVSQLPKNFECFLRERFLPSIVKTLPIRI